VTEPSNAEFVRQLTDCQPWLRAFVRAILLAPGDVDEVVQRTNVVLWQKADCFEPGTSFRAWASQVARLEVLAYTRQQGEDRHSFNADLVQNLADEAGRQLAAPDDMRAALRQCLGNLSEGHRKLIQDRYAKDGSVKDIADREGKTPDAISAMLYRIKQLLLKCIRGKLATDLGGSHV
jgi:RNA polymerase sigma-70 factor (ECF subfamily)